MSLIFGFSTNKHSLQCARLILCALDTKRETKQTQLDFIKLIVGVYSQYMKKPWRLELAKDERVVKYGFV